MKKNNLLAGSFRCCWILAVLPLTMSCAFQNSSFEDNNAQVNENLYLNQVGYCPGQVKIAIVPAEMDSFLIWNAETGENVFSGSPGPAAYWDKSGDTVRVADFSSLNAPGSYYITDEGKKRRSHVFDVREGIFKDVAAAALKAFYYNRTFIPIEEQYGGKWARPAGHPDTIVLIHESAATATRKAGDTISSPYGWYDAGDYNKYVVNSGITNWTLLSFFETFSESGRNLAFDIPEKDNQIPDLLDEAYFNLRWVISMQDEDGGVYHKLTTKTFEGFVMPDQAVKPRYVVQKTTAATLDFAASMAQAARVYKEYLPDFSGECLDAAIKAWQWAMKNPGILYQQPSDIQTGAYGDDELEDEFAWAAIELYLTTGDSGYLKDVDMASLSVDDPQWADVASLGIISLAIHQTDLSAQAQEKIIARAAELYEKYKNSPFRVSLDFFRWGSNSDVAIQGMIKLLAYKFSGEGKYLESAIGDLDYLLGKNATGYSFVTGIGDKPAMNIHHRPSGADTVAQPVPGFLVGGPNLAVPKDCPEVQRSEFPAKSYSDLGCSYSTNEIAINWNAPLFYLAAGINEVCR